MDTLYNIDMRRPFHPNIRRLSLEIPPFRFQVKDISFENHVLGNDRHVFQHVSSNGAWR
jgi:hypothetical protein